jgi:pimeloyl-ACP methyl ester carboxylesterase
MDRLALTRRGTGAPLVLLHGIGMSRAAWNPVLPALAERFDVLAVDLPGFGGSPPLPPEVEPHPAALAAAVAGLLDDLGIRRPHVAGNSLGGWVALELARLRPLASLALLSPAGLWRGSTPVYQRLSLHASRGLSRHAAGSLDRLVEHPLGRVLVLGQTHGRPARMSPGQARTVLADMAGGPGFDAVAAATRHRHYVAGPVHDVPVTVAFGTRDRLLPRGSRNLGELPPDACLAALPGCGHVPMADDPAAVTALIAAATARARPDTLMPGSAGGAGSLVAGFRRC